MVVIITVSYCEGILESEFGFRRIELKAKRGVGSSKFLSTFRPGRCLEIPEILKFVLKCPEIHCPEFLTHVLKFVNNWNDSINCFQI